MLTEICPICFNIFTVTKEEQEKFDKIEDATCLVNTIALCHGHSRREIRKKNKRWEAKTR